MNLIPNLHISYSLKRLIPVFIVCCLIISCDSANDPQLEEYPDLKKIKIDGSSFTDGSLPFTPWGLNYTHTDPTGLIEDRWDQESTWSTIDEDFKEMKSFGMNIVRIHLQTHNYLESPSEVKEESITQLLRLVDIAEKYGLYLDVTGLASYRKSDDPSWYRNLDETGRWTAHETFWKAIAEALTGKDVIFAYNLMNEPVSVIGTETDWLPGDGFGGFHFVQRISLDSNGRPAVQIMRDWMDKLSDAIRIHDSTTPITVGFLPLGTPTVYSDHITFISAHLYPRADDITDAQDFIDRNQSGTPLLLEETSTLYMGAEELGDFLVENLEAGKIAGVISHYDGKTLAEKAASSTIQDAVRKAWLEQFISIRP